MQDKLVRITFMDGSSDVAIYMFGCTYWTMFFFDGVIQEINNSLIAAVTQLDYREVMNG